MRDFNVLIVGGGASGMYCALQLAEYGVKNVAIVEKNERLGRKLSATGNGQGNVSNTDISASHYFSSTGSAEAVLKQYDQNCLIQYLTKIGGLFSADEKGRIYPVSRQASSVTDILRFAIQKRGVRVFTGENVVGVNIGGGAKKFLVTTETDQYNADVLVLACGGMASPHFGADGAGYEFAKRLGLAVTKLDASLVRLKTDMAYIRGLKGIRLDCDVCLRRYEGEDKIDVCRRRGDVLFTGSGVSGDVIFWLSAFAKSNDLLAIDFLPDFPSEKIIDFLQLKITNYPEMMMEDIMRCVVNSTVGRSVLKSCSIDFTARAKQTKERVWDIADRLKNFVLQVTGKDGFANAQVTKGGVSMKELDFALMSKKVKDLYVVGELVDIDGECGGYNLQWAFSSGAVAAKGIAARCANVD